MTITRQEAKNWLASQDFVKCREIETNCLFDATLVDGDVVMIRQTASAPQRVYLISLDLFAQKFEETYIPPHWDDPPANH